MNNFPNMFSPLQIGSTTIKNRFVVPPMSNNFALPDGSLSDRSLAYYCERAKGGFGLITIEATVVDKTAKGGPRKHCLYDDSMIEGLRETVDGCHEYGSKISIQLQHAGPEGNAKAAGYPLRAASPIEASQGRDIPNEMSTEEIYALVELYGDAALRAYKAGVDAIEIHCAHGYLVSGFLSPNTNKRVDEFGGSFENRMRLPRLIIENIRKKTGDSIALLCRINSSDEIEGGLDLRDNALIASYLEECGIDALNVSRSVHIRDEFMWAPTVTHAGFNLEHITEIKRAVSIPVIMVGRFTDPWLPELLVKEGRCDMVAFGRQSIADPWLPNKAASGYLDELNHCIACLQGCVHNMFQGKPITCLVNPLAGRENDLKKTEHSKRILVAGGGVGGMYAAMTLAQRGHNVTLMEKDKQLGGQMLLAAYPPGKGDITNMVRTYTVLCQNSGVDIQLNTTVTKETIHDYKPDAIVLATGGKPLELPLPGIKEFSVNAIEVLEGKVACGKKVLVVGGGMVGCETADFLAVRGHKVTIIELREEIAADVISEHRIFLLNSFNKNAVETITGAKVREFVAGGVFFEDKNGDSMQLNGFDTVILALGTKAFNPLKEIACELVNEVHVIGDAVKARRALDATAEALNTALLL